jgi:hypothetical protein
MPKVCTFVTYRDEKGREVDGDWLCPTCFALYRAGKTPSEVIHPICMHCVRRIRRDFPPTHTTGRMEDPT